MNKMNFTINLDKITYQGFALGLMLLVANTSHAGEQLFLRSGVIDTKIESMNYSATISFGEDLAGDYIVQFKNNPTESDKASLKKRGVQIFKYLPDDAYLVRANIAQLNSVKSLATINAVIAYSPMMKISPDFGSFSVFTAQKIENVLIKTFSDSDRVNVVTGMTSISPSIVVLKDSGNSILVNIPQENIYQVASLQGIEHMQPFVPMQMWDGMDLIGSVAPAATPGDYTDINGDEDGTKIMNFNAAYTAGFTGKGEMAAMADTGVDSGDLNTLHADLRGAVYKGYIHGMFSKSWNDPMGHGSHVAGSIVSRGTNSSGKIHGGAVEGLLVAQGMWSPTLENLTVPTELKTLFDSSYADGARVHSNSWGAARNFGAYDNYAVQVDEFVWNHQDMLPVFAAGNSGIDQNIDGRIDLNSMSSPGTAKNCLTVGASENFNDHGGIQAPIGKLKSAPTSWPAEPIQSDFLSNNPNGLAMFSSRGPTLDGRTKPDVVAPGTNILSVKSQVEGASDMWGAYNKMYTYAGGTSMATPLTAGAALIARQKLKSMGVKVPSAALVKGLLMHTAVDIFPGQFGAIGAAKGQEILTQRPNSDEGYGRVDVAGVVNTPMQVVDEVSGVAQGQSLTYQIKLETKLNKAWFTLVYTDAPATASAAKTLVNDIDLAVTTPDGKVLTLTDKVNNHEMIEIPNAEAGTYKVVVIGQRIPQGKQGKQPFALLMSAN